MFSKEWSNHRRKGRGERKRPCQLEKDVQAYLRDTTGLVSQITVNKVTITLKQLSQQSETQFFWFHSAHKITKYIKGGAVYPVYWDIGLKTNIHPFI